jgi:hypothetical protein
MRRAREFGQRGQWRCGGRARAWDDVLSGSAGVGEEEIGGLDLDLPGPDLGLIGLDLGLSGSDLGLGTRMAASRSAPAGANAGGRPGPCG